MLERTADYRQYRKEAKIQLWMISFCTIYSGFKEILPMATSKDYLNLVLDQLSNLEDITYRQMMGDYIICFGGKIAAYLWTIDFW